MAQCRAEPLAAAPAVAEAAQGRAGSTGAQQGEAALSVGSLCACYICVHAQAFQVLVCHRRRRLNNRAVRDRNGLSFILISFLCLCWLAATAGNDGYRKGNL